MDQQNSLTGQHSDLFDQLCEAVTTGDIASLKETILSPSLPKSRRRKLLKQKDEHGDGLLNLAAVNGNLPIVQFFIDELGANIDSQGAEKRTPLLLACLYGHADLVRYLIKKGADLTAEETRHGSQAIHLAATSGDVATIELLFAANPQWLDKPNSKISRTPLLCAAAFDRLAAIKMLVAKGADVTLRDKDGAGLMGLAASFCEVETVQYLLHLQPKWWQLDEHGQNLFQVAVIGENLVIAKFLVENGFDIDAGDHENCNALHTAAEVCEHVEIINYLLQLRPQWLEARDGDGRTPLLHAASRGNLVAFKHLMELGADVEVRDFKSEALAIHVAVESENPEIVEYLLELKPDWLEVRDGKYDRTPFLSASKEGNAAVLKLLVQKGAKIDVQDSESQAWAINLAAGSGSVEAIEYLLELRPEWLEVRDGKFGRTPLIEAAAGNNVEVVKFLLKAGADARSQDTCNGGTAFHVAAEYQNRDVCKLLFEKDPTLLKIKNSDGRRPLEITPFK